MLGVEYRGHVSIFEYLLTNLFYFCTIYRFKQLLFPLLIVSYLSKKLISWVPIWIFQFHMNSKLINLWDFLISLIVYHFNLKLQAYDLLTFVVLDFPFVGQHPRTKIYLFTLQNSIDYFVVLVWVIQYIFLSAIFLHFYFWFNFEVGSKGFLFAKDIVLPVH